MSGEEEDRRTGGHDEGHEESGRKGNSPDAVSLDGDRTAFRCQPAELRQQITTVLLHHHPKLVGLDAGPFNDGFHHVDGWVPQRLVTA
ncbi:MAG: hypothetical protein ABWY57_12020, partial [Mycetocola sp.]